MKIIITFAAVAAFALSANAFDSTGIAECDSFLTNYEACIAKMPAELQEGFATTVSDLADGYRISASVPEAREAILQSCIATAANMEESLAAYDCDF